MALDPSWAKSTDRGQRPLLHNTPRHEMPLVGAVTDREPSTYDCEASISNHEASIADRNASPMCRCTNQNLTQP
jgi:hypothetical protein